MAAAHDLFRNLLDAIDTGTNEDILDAAKLCKLGGVTDLMPDEVPSEPTGTVIARWTEDPDVFFGPFASRDAAGSALRSAYGGDYTEAFELRGLQDIASLLKGDEEGDDTRMREVAHDTSRYHIDW